MNNLVSGLPEGKMKKEEIGRALQEAGIDSSRRGETLSMDEFAALSDALMKNFEQI